MRSRVLIAMVVAAAVSLALFALPLAELVQEYYRDQARVALDERVTDAVPIVSADPARIDEKNTDPDYRLGAYASDGNLIAGRGPQRADAIVSSAVGGRTASVLADDGSIAVAVPVPAGPTAAVRAEAAAAVVDARVRTAWALIVGLALGVLAVVGLGAWFLSRRLVRPVDALTADLVKLRDGDFVVDLAATGVVEIDAAYRALAATAERLGDTLEGERAFSADVAHQLRTPIASLRLGLESELHAPRGDPTVALHEALDEVDRLQSTTEDLLALARHDDATVRPIEVGPWLQGVRARWERRFLDADRDLSAHAPDEAPAVLCHRSRLDQAVDIAVDNALCHGQGTVTVAVSPARSQVHVSVRDEGPGIARAVHESDPNRDERGKRIGLDLARRLVESDGGRLRIARSGQPVFTMILPAAADETLPSTSSTSPVDAP